MRYMQRKGKIDNKAKVILSFVVNFEIQMVFATFQSPHFNYQLVFNLFRKICSKLVAGSKVKFCCD